MTHTGHLLALGVRRINPLSVLPLILILVATDGIATDAPSYQFAGLSAETTFAEIRDRYPRSAFSDGYARISQSDSHDHIFAISVSNQRVRIGFQETDYESGHQFPSCDSVSLELIEANGASSETQEFYEAATLSKRIIWKSENETMVLQCFQRDEQFFAEAVSFYKN